MQENNNVKTIANTWERRSGDQGGISVLESMSGDSRSFQPSKKKEDETNLMILERPKGPIATAASAGAVVAAVETTQTDNTIGVNPEDKEKPEPVTFNKEETKEAAGDANYSKDNKDDKEDKSDKAYLENDSFIGKTPESSEKTQGKGDNVDSVYLRPPPPHKVRSTASIQDDEDCAFKCLYYTLQCCDCVLM